MSALPAPVALVDAQRELVAIDRRGVFHPLTRDPSTAGLWGALSAGSDSSPWRAPPPSLVPGEGPARSTWAWPTWSPDGRRLACFRYGPGADGVTSSAFVHVLDLDGVHAAELLDLEGRLPIYLQWSPDQRHLALLSQAADRLHLSLTRPDEPGVEVPLADGSPLFFAWTGGRRPRVAAFVGSGSNAHLGVYDPSGHATTRLPGVPGNFCTPIVLGDRFAYVAWHGGRSVICTAELGDTEPTPLETLDGLAALVRSPDGAQLARAIAPGGDGTAYRDLGVIDLTTGRVHPVSDRPCLAFLWLPDGSGFVTAHVDTEKNLLVWSRQPLHGPAEPFLSMVPSRDLGFYLRFFEQYAESHPILDPTGQHLLLGGVLPGREGDQARVWQVRITDGRAEALAEGLFGVYGPGGAD